MKVLHIGPAITARGGIASVIQSYIDNIDKKMGVEIITLPSISESGKFFIFIIALFKVVYLKFDIAHIHLASNGSFYRKFLFFILVKIRRKKVVVHLHGGGFSEFHSRSPWLIRKLIFRMFYASDTIILLSLSWKAWFESEFSNYSGKVIVLYNGAPAIRKLSPDYEGSLRLLFLGKISKEKGIYDLLNVCKDLSARGISYHLKIGGVGESDKLCEMIKREGLGRYVGYEGWVTGDEKDQLLRWANCFILPSYFEGFPVSIVEAMSYGLPIIASDVGGVTDAVRHEREALVISAGNNVGLYEAIKSMSIDVSLRRSLGQAALQRFTDKLSIEENIKNLVDIYLRMRN